MENLSLYLQWFATLHSQIVSFVSTLAILLSTCAVFYLSLLGYRYLVECLMRIDDGDYDGYTGEIPDFPD